MGGRKAQRPRSSGAALPSTECPHCGGALEFEAGLPEGLCPNCGIYVEFLGKRDSPPIEKAPPPLDSGLIENALKSDLEELSRAVGLKTSGKKTDLTARLRRYLELREAASAGQTDSDSERRIARRGLVLFLLSLGVGRKAAEAMASLFGSLRTFQRAAQDDVELLAGVSSAEALRIREAIAHGETVPPPEVPPPPEAPPATEVQPAPDTQPPPTIAPAEAQSEEARSDQQLELVPPEDVAPSTAPVLEPPELVPEPRLERAPEQESILRSPATMESVAEPVTESTDTEEVPATATASRLRRDRWLLYAGTLLQAIGGFGLILGSLLHDVFRVPIFGRNYAAFGSVNALFAVVGVMLLMAGLAAIGFSLRGGVAQSASATEV